MAKSGDNVPKISGLSATRPAVVIDLMEEKEVELEFLENGENGRVCLLSGEIRGYCLRRVAHLFCLE